MTRDGRLGDSGVIRHDRMSAIQMSRLTTIRGHVSGLIIGPAATAATVAILRLFPDISPTTAAVALLLLVLGVATLSALWVALLTAFVATVALNFVFLPPVGTLTIADPQNWIALFAFLLTAVVASKLSAVARDRARDAIARRDEVTRLFDLTRDVLLTTETAGAIETIARQVARRFDLGAVAICLPDEAVWRLYQGGRTDLQIDTADLNIAFAKSRGTLEYDARRRAYGGHLRVGEDGRVSVVPLRHGTKAVGLMAAESTQLDIGTLDAVAGVVAIAIERAQFLGERDAALLVRQKADLAATLLATLSHDLRTPLTAIRMAVENLRGELDAEGRRVQASAAVEELDRLNRLFADILDMARIDASAISVERHWVTPPDVVDAAAAQIRHTLEGRTLHVDAQTDVEIEIDPRVSSLALSHLLENAARYSPTDRAIDVTAGADAEGLRVSVTDHGSGLDAAELHHVFERFYRGTKAKQLAPGTGMGLAITRGLLAALGGRVWAENAPDAGARFTMVVPGGVRQPVSAE